MQTAKGKQRSLLFPIVPDENQLLLGDKSLDVCGLVKRIYPINKTIKEDKFLSVFKGH